MQLAFPLELDRPAFGDHLSFLKQSGAQQVPLYFMAYDNTVATPAAPGAALDGMLATLDRQVAEIRQAGLAIDVLYVDFRVKPASLVGDDPGQRGVMTAIARRCGALGFRQIGFFPDNPARDKADAAWFRRETEGYRIVADLAGENGLKVSTHINMIAGSRFDRVEDIDEMLAAVDRANWGLLFCFGCIALAGLDVADMIRHWRDRVFVVHLRDVLGSWKEGASEVLFGQGRIDLPAAMRALREIGYDGILHPEHFPNFSHETEPTQRLLFRHPWDRAPFALAWTLGYCRGLLQETKR